MTSGSLHLSADAAVIGSGAAGAVVAARLAERGARVVLLEEGPRPRPGDLDGNVPAAVRQYYRNGGISLALGIPPVPVLVGRCVGGSTVINGGTCFRTPAAVLQAWSDAVQGAYQPADLTPYFEAVERDLGVSEVPADLAHEGDRRFLAAARARGNTGGFVKRNVRGCQGVRLCPFGCPTGAKQSMELTYVPRAERHGAQVLERTRVERILLRDGRVVGVRGRRLLESRATEVEVESPVVMLCAGALHSPVLLRESLGWRAPRATGRHLYLHPGAHVLGIFPGDVGPQRGPNQGVYVEGEGGGYVIFGMGYPPEVLAPILVRGAPDIRRLAAYPRSVIMAVMASDHHSRGRVRRMPGGGPLPSYFLHPGDSRTLVRGIAHAADLFFDMGAAEVDHGVRGVEPFATPADVRAFRRRRVPPRALTLGSVHPMGSCRMGLDPRQSVVGPHHSVHGVRGLYVPDASFFPSSLGVNPQITINAFAMRCADLVAKAV